MDEKLEEFREDAGKYIAATVSQADFESLVERVLIEIRKVEEAYPGAMSAQEMYERLEPLTEDIVLAYDEDLRAALITYTMSAMMMLLGEADE